MQKFQFQITQKYVNQALKIITPYWVEVTYSVVNNKVVVEDIKIPYTILTYLTGYHLANAIYYAAENNHASNMEAKKPLDVFATIYDHFQIPAL